MIENDKMKSFQCGMVYCVDDVEDVKTHEEFHSVHRFEIPSTHDSTFL